jgi:cyclase
MTLKNRIIPCLDVKDGRVVKGINFENLIDAGDPVAQAKFYYEQGADELCFLDISASQENRSTMLDMVKKVAQVCFIPFTVGGGIRELQDFTNLLQCGADKVSINSAAIKNPQLITQASNKFGAQAVVVAIDAKKNASGNYEIFSHGGQRETGIDAIAWAKEVQKLGAGEILLTSIDRDGSKRGYDLELLEKITSQLEIPVIASGGVGNLEHLRDGLKAGAAAVLAASIFTSKLSLSHKPKNFCVRKISQSAHNNFILTWIKQFPFPFLI